MSDSIEIGDTVEIHFSGAPSMFRAVVIGIPQATGDSWRLKTESGDISYVQMFERMDKINNPE